MDPARGREEHISAITAAVMNVKTHVTIYEVQYARLPPALIPVEKVTRTPPTKYSAATQMSEAASEVRELPKLTKSCREVVEQCV